MAGKIFISYRRDDAKADARSLYQQLSRAFGARRLFMDIDTIEKGRDFALVLNEHLTQSSVLLAVIGPKWLSMRNAQGVRRLDDPADFVRLEIASALKRDIAVIPVLVDGARLPSADELSADLKPLARRQAVIITHENFKSDANQLEAALKRILSPPSRFGWKAAIGAAAIATGIGAAAFLKTNRMSWPIPAPDEAAAVVVQPPPAVVAPPANPFDIALLPAAVATEVQKAREAQRHAVAAAEEGCMAGDKAELAAAKAKQQAPGTTQVPFDQNDTKYVYMGEDPVEGAYGVVTKEWGSSLPERFSLRFDADKVIRNFRGVKPSNRISWTETLGIGRVIGNNGGKTTYCGRVDGSNVLSGRMTWWSGEISEIEGIGFSIYPRGYGATVLADGRRSEGFFEGPALNGIGVIWTKDGRIESVGQFERGVLTAPMEGK